MRFIATFFFLMCVSTGIAGCSQSATQDWYCDQNDLSCRHGWVLLANK